MPAKAKQPKRSSAGHPLSYRDTGLPPPRQEVVPVDGAQAPQLPDFALTEAISKAELDAQITTARAFPRSVAKFREECLGLATLTVSIAEQCFYAVPRSERGQQKMVEGPSVRFAEIVLSSWGNCRAGARILEEGRETLTAQGVFDDLEKNSHIVFPVKRRIVTREGVRFSTELIAVTSNAAASIALRSAIFRGIPRAYWEDIYQQVRRTAVGDSQTLANRRSDALAYLQKIGATVDQVLAVLGVAGVEDIGLEELATLRGLANSIKDGELTVEQAFAPKEPVPTGTAGAKELLKGGAS
jgi:hypothetical protein